MKNKIIELINFYEKEITDFNLLFDFYIETGNEKMSDFYQEKINNYRKFINDLKELLK